MEGRTEKFTPRWKLHPQVKTSPPGENFTPRGQNSPLGEKFTSGDKIHLWGTTSPPGSKFAPRDEVKNGPLTLNFQVVNQTDCAIRFSRIKSVEISETQICAMDPAGAADACQGDSAFFILGPILRSRKYFCRKVDNRSIYSDSKCRQKWSQHCCSKNRQKFGYILT
jgi:hypothetical protein